MYKKTVTGNYVSKVHIWDRAYTLVEYIPVLTRVEDTVKRAGRMRFMSYPAEIRDDLVLE